MKLFILLLVLPMFVLGQYEYEATSENPFGKLNPAASKQLLDFKPMIGVCDCSSINRNADGSWATAVKMSWKFKYIMNGMAIQDETLKEDGKHSGSIRQYNPDSAKWYVHYYASSGAVASLPVWEGNKVGDKIILYRDQKAPNGMEGSYRLTFYEMNAKGYKWVGEWVSKDESIVYPTWKIDCIKIKG